MKTTWILVANKARAVILAASSPHMRPLIVDVFEHPEGRLKNSDLHSDRPGQLFESRGVARHAAEPSEDPVEHETRRFVRELGKRLEIAVEIGKFDELVVVCSHAIGAELRDLMPPQVGARLATTVTKDIAGWTNAELIAAVRQILDERPAAPSHK